MASVVDYQWMVFVFVCLFDIWMSSKSCNVCFNQTIIIIIIIIQPNTPTHSPTVFKFDFLASPRQRRQRIFNMYHIRCFCMLDTGWYRKWNDKIWQSQFFFISGINSLVISLSLSLYGYIEKILFHKSASIHSIFIHSRMNHTQFLYSSGKKHLFFSQWKKNDFFQVLFQ